MKRKQFREDGCSNRRSMRAYSYSKMCSYIWKCIDIHKRIGVDSPEYKKAKVRLEKWKSVDRKLHRIVMIDEGDLCT
jgi:hypothetical protein